MIMLIKEDIQTLIYKLIMTLIQKKLVIKMMMKMIKMMTKTKNSKTKISKKAFKLMMKITIKSKLRELLILEKRETLSFKGFLASLMLINLAKLEEARSKWAVASDF